MADQLRRTRELMNHAVRNSVVTGYEKRIGELTLPDSDDRHVLAAATHTKANFILTLNTRDFPKAALEPHGIVSRHPDDFLASLLDNHAERVCRVAWTQRSALLAQPLTVKDFLEALREVGLPETTARLEQRREEL